MLGSGSGDAGSNRFYSGQYGGSGAMVRVWFPVTMRDIPNLTYTLGGNGVVDTDFSSKDCIQLFDASDTAWRIYDVLAEKEL